MHAWEGTQWVNRYYCFHRYMYTSGYSTYHTTHLHAKALAKCCNNVKVHICSVYGAECILLSSLELLSCLYAGHRDLVNAKSPEHRLQIFSYRLCHFCVCICLPKAIYSALWEYKNSYPTHNRSISAHFNCN